MVMLFEYATEELKGDHEIVMKAVSQVMVDALQATPQTMLKGDPEIDDESSVP